MQVQESEPTTSYVVNDPSFPKISPNFVDTSDLNLPIAVRKDTRTCTRYLLYPLFHFVSYERLSSSHRNFLTGLNTIVIPKTLFEALISKERKQAMRARWKRLKRMGLGMWLCYQERRVQ